MFHSIFYSSWKHTFYTPKVKDLGKSNKHSCMFFIASPVLGIAFAWRIGIKYLTFLLWNAFELVSLHGQKQWHCKRNSLLSVVNCFRISIFTWAKTMTLQTRHQGCGLWIAFELVSLQWQKQYRKRECKTEVCCELLSN